jgi:hypothetical protein
MNKPLVIIVILSVIYLLLVALSPNAQRVEGKFARLEYGYVTGPAPECDMNLSHDKISKELYYYVQRIDKKVKVEFFCFDENKYKDLKPTK